MSDLSVPGVLLVRGCPRSGTTLVADLINASDRAAIMFEYPLGQLVRDLQPILAYARDHVQLREKTFATAAQPGDRDSSYYNELRPTLLAATFPTPERLGPIVAAVVAASLGKRDVTLIGSKTPGSVALRDHELLAPFFPAIKFLFVVRDPLAAINSMMNRRNRARLGLDDWPFADVGAAIAEYRQNTRLLFSHVARYGDRCLVVKYEDLLDRFTATAAAIDGFLGSGFDLAAGAAKLVQHGIDAQAATKDVLAPDEGAAVRAAFGDAIDDWQRKELTGLHPGALDALADCADAFVPDTRYRYDGATGERRCLGLGWSMLEPDGVWSESERADLFFTVPEDGDYAVSLDASLFVPVAGEAPALRVEANGVDVLRRPGADFSGPGPHALACRPVRFAAGGVQRLSVHIDPARSPLECGISPDDRRLGLRLHGLSLARA